MFLSALIFLIAAAETATTNYEYRQKNTISYTPHIFNSSSLYDFFLPANDTILLQFKYQVYMVNDNLPYTFMKRFTKSSGDFYFGRKKMMINFDDIVMEVHKSYQYPDKRVENIYFNQQVINRIIPFNSTFALLAAQFQDYVYVGRYQYNTENIDFKFRSSMSCGKFLSMLKLLADDLLLICNSRIYIFNELTLTYDNFLSGNNFKQSDIKAYSKNSTETLIIQYLMVTVDTLVKKYRRFLTFYNGSITNRTSFELQIQFIDHSLNSSYDFINETHIHIFNNRSEVIIRNASIKNPFICSASSILPKNAVKIQGTNDLFIFNGSIYRVNYKNCSVTITYKNLTNATNQIRAWATNTSRFITQIQNVVYITFPLDGTKNISNIIDCQVIDNNLYYITNNSAKLLVVYDVNLQKNLTNISLSKYSTIDIQMEAVNQDGNRYILLQINQADQPMHEVWYYNQTSSALERQTLYSHPVSLGQRTIIPSSPTFQLWQQQSGSNYMLNFFTLDNRMVTSKKVNQYKSLKVIDNAVVLYFEKDSRYFEIYRFSIDVNTKSIMISQKPVVIQLEQISSSIGQKRLFLIEDNKDSENFIIYFSDQSKSYFYNTLDPIIKSTKLPFFDLKTSPLAIRNQFFFILSNNSFLQVTSDPNNLNVYSQQFNFSPIFNDCLSIKMRSFKKGSYDFIDFQCQLQKKVCSITYNLSTIFQNNIHSHEKLMFFQKTIKDYAINENGDFLLMDVIRGSDYLEFYKNEETSLIILSQMDILCKSESGVYIVYNNTKQSQLYTKDLQTHRDYKIMSQPYDLTSYNCTIDDTGDWVIFYNINRLRLVVFQKNSFLKQIKMNYLPINVTFFGKKVFIRTSNDILFLNDIVNGNVVYIEKNNRDYSIAFDLNQNFIAYSNDSSHLIICEQQNCYAKFDEKSQKKVRRLYSDGRFVSYTSKTLGQFSIFGKQLISCGDGKYISNGVCLDCPGSCNSCEAQTGACLDCQYGNGYKIAMWVLIVVIIIITICVLLVYFWRVKSKKKNQLYANLLSRQEEIEALRIECRELKKNNKKLKEQKNQIKNSNNWQNILN